MADDEAIRAAVAAERARVEAALREAVGVKCTATGEWALTVAGLEMPVRDVAWRMDALMTILRTRLLDAVREPMPVAEPEPAPPLATDSVDLTGIPPAVARVVERVQREGRGVAWRAGERLTVLLRDDADPIGEALRSAGLWAVMGWDASGARCDREWRFP